MKKLIFTFTLLIFCSTAWSQPKADAWNGVCYAVKDYMKENANDPKSIKYVECSYISKFSNGNYGQRVKYRGKNAFGATVLNEHYFIMKGSGFDAKVEGMFDMETMKAAMSTGKIKIVARYDSSGNRVNDQ